MPRAILCVHVTQSVSKFKKKAAGDAKLAARLMTEQTRAWSNSLFLSTLDDLSYSAEQKKDILNEYFYRFEEELLSSPEYYMPLALWNAFIIIEKS